MIQIYLAELYQLLLGNTVKIFEILDFRQRDIPTQRFFRKGIAQYNGGMQSGHAVGTLPIVIGR